MITIKYNGKLPRTNQRYYKNFSLTKQYREAKETLQWAAKIDGKGKVFDCDVFCSIWLNSKTYKGDIDGCLKGILDAMNGIIYKDDKQIKNLSISKMKIDYDLIIVVGEYDNSQEK